MTAGWRVRAEFPMVRPDRAREKEGGPGAWHQWPVGTPLGRMPSEGVRGFCSLLPLHQDRFANAAVFTKTSAERSGASRNEDFEKELEG